MVWVLFAGLALWFSIGQVSRYALPFAPLMAVVAALPVGKWLPRIRGPLLTAGLLLAGLAYVGYMRSVATVWNYNIPDAYPYRFALGLESGEAFLTRALRVYPALHYIGQRKSGPESRVLSATAQIKYYADFAVDDPVFSSRVSDLAAMTAGEALYNELTSRGYEYVLIDNDLLKGGKPPVYATPAFLQQYAQIAFAANRVMVYRLKGDKPVERNARELLTNNGFDALDGNSQPTGWIRFGNPLTVVDPKRAASAPACVEVTQDDGLYQRVPAKKEQTYLVRIRARSDSPDQSAWLQIVWFNRSLAIVDGSITAVKVDGSWREYEVPVTAVHPEVAFGAAYARAAAGSKVLVDDVSFSLLE